MAIVHVHTLDGARVIVAVRLMTHPAKFLRWEHAKLTMTALASALAQVLTALHGARAKEALIAVIFKITAISL